MSERYGLIFDVDGVIADTEALNAAVSRDVLRERCGLQGVERADFEAGLGRGAEEYLRAAARVHGRELGREEVAAAARERQERFLERLAAEPLLPFPGVLALMEAGLARDDFRLAVATSSAREKSEAVLRSSGVPWRRMEYVTGSDVRRRKPDPELFLAAAGRLGLPPRRCAVIEDARDGIAAARAAGCRAIAVTNSLPAAALGEADRVVASLEEIDIEAVRELIRSPPAPGPIHPARGGDRS